MGVVLYTQPKLKSPALVACWPGIGEIGMVAINALRRMVGAREFGEIEPHEFFYPKRVFIRDGELRDLEFPSSKFYFKADGERDLIFFVGEEQPAEGGATYARGAKAYRMANLVMDVALQFGCRRVYTSGAAVAPIHHTARSKVWAVPNSASLLPEIHRYDNTVLMSDMEDREEGVGSITGLNGLLLGVAWKRGIEGVCLMGEIPVYLQGFPIRYPKASKSVIEVLSAALGITANLGILDPLIEQTEKQIDRLYDSLPSEIQEQLEKLKYVSEVKRAEPGPITEEDKKKILDDLDKFFKRGPKEQTG